MVMRFEFFLSRPARDQRQNHNRLHPQLILTLRALLVVIICTLMCLIVSASQCVVVNEKAILSATMAKNRIIARVLNILVKESGISCATIKSWMCLLFIISEIVVILGIFNEIDIIAYTIKCLV